MLVKSARIIGQNIGFYLFIAFMLVAVGTLDSLGYLGGSGRFGMIAAFTCLSANLPVMILQNVSLTAAVAKTQKSEDGFATFLKVGLIATLLAGFTVYVTTNAVADLPPGTDLPIFDKLVLAGLLVIVLPMIVTVLGSWIPAGIINKEAGFLKALGRGLMSIHTVYWRLVLAFGAFFLALFAIALVYVTAFRSAPSIATPSGGIDPWSVACWYLVSLAGLALVTYANVVVCLCYARAEKIDLSAVAPAPTEA